MKLKFEFNTWKKNLMTMNQSILIFVSLKTWSVRCDCADQDSSDFVTCGRGWNRSTVTVLNNSFHTKGSTTNCVFVCESSFYKIIWNIQIYAAGWYRSLQWWWLFIDTNHKLLFLRKCCANWFMDTNWLHLFLLSPELYSSDSLYHFPKSVANNQYKSRTFALNIYISFS